MATTATKTTLTTQEKQLLWSLFKKFYANDNWGTNHEGEPLTEPEMDILWSNIRAKLLG